VFLSRANSERHAVLSDNPKNWQQVRDKIQQGESGDKIGGFDPAAAPLGTDDEAGAMPSHPVKEDANPGGAKPRRDQVRRE
jgi:hypothetical protein